MDHRTLQTVTLPRHSPICERIANRYGSNKSRLRVPKGGLTKMARESSSSDRKLRVFAFDPSFARRLSTYQMNELVVTIPGEMEARTEPGHFSGPVGEYLEVIDVDPASGLFYPPVNLDDPKLLVGNGLAPTESNPQFHQQMVYAVAMSTIAAFEKALGRIALWAPREKRDDQGKFVSDEFVRRLRIYPHALREANAYYSPSKKALLFGYFEAEADHPSVVPGSLIFSCLSHDVIAHETTHALLDGLHPRMSEVTNPDMLALHEGFADIVALFLHFSYPQVLTSQIAKTRGNLRSDHLLGQLAQEFGLALGRGGALRDAIGGPDSNGTWQLRKPDRAALSRAKGPHARGAILVAAVFRAFLNMYESRTADLFRIATQGTGVLPPGDIHPDLVNRLAEAAAKSATHLLEICIRGLDYCPPVDITFGDYLRAIITADTDLYPEDEHNYRVAILEAFVEWGIVPHGMQTVSQSTLLWPTLREVAADMGVSQHSQELESELGVLIADASAIRKKLKNRPDVSTNINDRLDRMAEQISALMNSEMMARLAGKRDPKVPDRELSKVTGKYEIESGPPHSASSILSQNLLELGLAADREITWHAQNFYGQLFWGLLTDPDNAKLLGLLGLTRDAEAPSTVYRSRATRLPAIQVHSVRMSNRRGTRGQVEREYVVELVQRRAGFLDLTKQQEMDRRPEPFWGDEKEQIDFRFRRGCTLLIDARSFRVRRVIRTRGDVTNNTQLEQVRKFLARSRSRPLDAFHVVSDAGKYEAFAMLHRHVSEEDASWQD